LSVCGNCGAESPPGQRFCGHCGAALSRACPSCGIENPPENRFCGSCGAVLAGAAAPAPDTAPPAVSERRLVSVLFADLVGFTGLSEHRDPEEVRELLSEYFDRSRALIERYGGTVEKFIGDAVMAVWGTPVTREDDAERAVRAALSLTQAVTLLGEEVGMPALRVRAGVLTGNAAVEVGNEGEGMVLGDTVNTASRLQSIAEPGTVLVDDVTRRASEAAIAYEDAGEHRVKGREQTVHAWTALRVVAGAGGARRSVGLEAPFVARARELQTIVETAEASAVDGQARLVAVIGEAGSGKSRLLWEYFKYVDGVEKVVLWHQGRCLSYGEGVSYWALAEIVRTRAGINEEDRPEVARTKLRDSVREFVSDERERRLIEPRLAHLLRLEERPDADRADLFSGWRLFFERMSERAPVVLVFEDLQWADSGLLDFIDYLLEWSADYPIFVLALGRHELRQRRETWQPIELQPLDPKAITTIVEGLAPGLPAELMAEIARRAEGIPLYAVETIRMLKDRGALTQSGAQYVLTGDISKLDVPETLQALVASRLDGLSGPERTLIQDTSVLGQSFTLAAASAVSSRPEAEVAPVLDALVAKQMLSHDDDPRSPERGQYAFLQALIRTVAYGTLSRKVRKAKHLAAARHLELTWPGEARDIAEVLASHYLQAIEAEPDADDADALRDSARETLTAAGDAAARLALGSEADRYFAQAAELVSDDLERARLFEQAGQALYRNGDSEQAEVRLRRAVELLQSNGKASGGSAAVTLAAVIVNTGRANESRELLEHFLATEDPREEPVLRGRALAALGNWIALRGEPAAAEPLFAEALQTLEDQGAMPILAEAMARRATHLDILRRCEESLALARHARFLAEEYDVPAVALRATFTIAASLIGRDRFAEAIPEINRALDITRERGDRVWEYPMLSSLVQCLTALGRWDEAMAKLPDIFEHGDPPVVLWAASCAVQIVVARGGEELRDRCMAVGQGMRDSANVDDRAISAIISAWDVLERGGTAAGVVEQLDPVFSEAGVPGEALTDAYRLAVEAALTGDDEDVRATLITFVDELPPARATPLLRAGQARLLAERAHASGDRVGAEREEQRAFELVDKAGARPFQAQLLLDRARRHDDREALSQARAIFVELGAVRWLERVDERFEIPA
jgi:class 3 adenylate cyclase/tetratricopeptide (TPR) repeat protein